MTDRNDIVTRILKLRALGEGTNSEAEAFAAMKSADRLMHAYRVDEAELAMAEALGEVKVEIVDEVVNDLRLNVGRNRHKVQACLWEIGAYCEVKVVLKWNDVPHVIGDRPDVELFKYLVELVKEALDREYDNWKRTQQSVGRGAKGSFQTAMARRISSRLSEMRRERAKERKGAVADAMRCLPVDEAMALQNAVENGSLKELTSTALVVASAAEVKEREVKAAYNRAYGGRRLRTAAGFSSGPNGNAYRSGAAAGDRVHLGRPIGKASMKAIGAR